MKQNEIFPKFYCYFTVFVRTINKPFEMIRIPRRIHLNLRRWCNTMSPIKTNDFKAISIKIVSTCHPNEIEMIIKTLKSMYASPKFRFAYLRCSTIRQSDSVAWFFDWLKNLSTANRVNDSNNDLQYQEINQNLILNYDKKKDAIISKCIKFINIYLQTNAKSTDNKKMLTQYEVALREIPRELLNEAYPILKELFESCSKPVIEKDIDEKQEIIELITKLNNTLPSYFDTLTPLFMLLQLKIDTYKLLSKVSFNTRKKQLNQLNQILSMYHLKLYSVANDLEEQEDLNAIDTNDDIQRTKYKNRFRAGKVRFLLEMVLVENANSSIRDDQTYLNKLLQAIKIVSTKTLHDGNDGDGSTGNGVDWGLDQIEEEYVDSSLKELLHDELGGGTERYDFPIFDPSQSTSFEAGARQSILRTTSSSGPKRGGDGGGDDVGGRAPLVLKKKELNDEDFMQLFPLLSRNKRYKVIEDMLSHSSPVRKLLLQNLSPDVTEEELMHILARHGNINYVKIFHPSKFEENQFPTVLKPNQLTIKHLKSV